MLGLGVLSYEEFWPNGTTKHLEVPLKVPGRFEKMVRKVGHAPSLFVTVEVIHNWEGEDAKSSGLAHYRAYMESKKFNAEYVVSAQGERSQFASAAEFGSSTLKNLRTREKKQG